jgi:hypothetical protein
VQCTSRRHCAEALIDHTHRRYTERLNLACEGFSIVGGGGPFTLQVDGQAHDYLEGFVLHSQFGYLEERGHSRQRGDGHRHRPARVRTGNTNPGLTDINPQPDALTH